MSVVRLYLLRHGEVARQDLFYGTTDLPLSEAGVRQAEAQARALASIRFDAIYSSDLQRAWVGAERLAAATGGPPPIAAPALREMCLGVLEGVPHHELAARFPQLVGLRFTDLLGRRIEGGGESIRDVAARVLPWLDAIVRRHLDGGRRVTLALVSHQCVLRVLLAQAAGVGPEGYLRFPQDVGAVARVDLPAAPTADATLLEHAIITRSNWRPDLESP